MCFKAFVYLTIHYIGCSTLAQQISSISLTFFPCSMFCFRPFLLHYASNSALLQWKHFFSPPPVVFYWILCSLLPLKSVVYMDMLHPKCNHVSTYLLNTWWKNGAGQSKHLLNFDTLVQVLRKSVCWDVWVSGCVQTFISECIICTVDTCCICFDLTW